MTPARDAQTARVVTISATYGAGGSFAAPLLATRLGLPFADRLTTAAGPPLAAGEERVTPQELDEEPRNPILEGLALLSTAWNMPVTRDLEDVPDRVRAHIEQGIQALLDTGGAVILGRGAAVPLGGYAGAFHVRLDGPPERRARRGAVWEGVDLHTAMAHLEETDSARSRSLRRLFGRHPSDPALYHLIIDSTTIAVDDLIEVIASAAQAFWRYDERSVDTVVAETRAHLSGPPP